MTAPLSFVFDKEGTNALVRRQIEAHPNDEVVVSDLSFDDAGFYPALVLITLERPAYPYIKGRVRLDFYPIAYIAGGHSLFQSYERDRG